MPNKLKGLSAVFQLMLKTEEKEKKRPYTNTFLSRQYGQINISLKTKQIKNLLIILIQDSYI